MEAAFSDGFVHPLNRSIPTIYNDGDGFHLILGYGATVGGFTATHPGEDWASETGSTGGAPVYAASNGKVIETGVGFYINQYMIIEHTLSTPVTVNGVTTFVVTTLYGNLAENHLVAVGDVVDKGQQISTVNHHIILNAAAALDPTPHLHFEVRLGSDGGYGNNGLVSRANFESHDYAAPSEFITRFAVIEPSIFTNSADMHEGGGDDDIFYTLAGDDAVSGGVGGDRISGGNGDDTLAGNGGDDALRGEDGDDNLFGGFGADRVDGGLGNDFIRTGPDNDTLIGGDGNDTLGASNRTDLLRGGVGNDLLLGSNGNDRLFGDEQDDTLLGGNGRDILEGGAGADRINGGGGNADTASYANAAAGVAARLDTAGGTKGEAAGDVFIAIENLRGSAFADTLIGDAGNNRVEGGDGDDFMFGNGGNDIIVGGAGDDTLIGDAGNDRFWFFAANTGDDRIADFAAGAGSDDTIRLFGFANAFDTFTEVLAAATQSGADTIIDFGGGTTVTLAGVNVADLHADDFVFG